MEPDSKLVIGSYQQLLANATHQIVLAEARAHALEQENAALRAELMDCRTSDRPAPEPEPEVTKK